MKRRDFIFKSAGAGIVAGALYGLGSSKNLYGNPAKASKFDMVALMGGEPEAMFDLGIQQLGGMQTFVAAGQSVLVKPDIGWNSTPDKATNTNPLLIKRIVEHCFKAGAKDVYVFDHSYDNWEDCYRNSGIEKAVKDSGGKMVPANTEKYYLPIEIPGGKRLKQALVHQLLLETDVFINVPILKSHSSAKVSGCLVNMMGMVWDRDYWYANDLNQCIADYALYQKKPNLNVLDCYNVMVKNGPQGISKDDLVLMGAQLISTDWVAVDAAGSKMLGVDPNKVGYISLCHDMGVGNKNLDTLEIDRIKL